MIFDLYILVNLAHIYMRTMIQAAKIVKKSHIYKYMGEILLNILILQSKEPILHLFPSSYHQHQPIPSLQHPYFPFPKVSPYL